MAKDRWKGVVDRVFPELAHFDSTERHSALYMALDTVKRRAWALFAIAMVAGYWAATWAVEQIPWLSGYADTAKEVLSGLFISSLFFGGFVVFRRHVRRGLRERLAADGVPICIPCGYNLTGNVSGVCPECGMPASMQIVGRVLVETTGEAGYRVDIAGDGQGGYVVTAVAHRGSERFVVRRADLYEAVVELAGQVGIELEDG